MKSKRSQVVRVALRVKVVAMHLPLLDSSSSSCDEIANEDTSESKNYNHLINMKLNFGTNRFHTTNCFHITYNFSG